MRNKFAKQNLQLLIKKDKENGHSLIACEILEKILVWENRIRVVNKEIMEEVKEKLN